MSVATLNLVSPAHRSAAAVCVAATRKVWFDLPVHDALRFVATQPGLLRTTAGRIWATREGTLRAPSDDEVIAEGDVLRMARGEQVVLESWRVDGACPSRFSWEPAGL